MSETLKPCPFCGGDPVFYRSTGRAHETGNIYSIYSVDCNDCDLTGPRSETRKGAAIAWNRRALIRDDYENRKPCKEGKDE